MLIDAHAHLDPYDEVTLTVALAEITQEGILTISTATDPASYERTPEIAAKCDLVLPAFGIHPWNAPAYAVRLDDIHHAVARSPVLGEIGLDYRFAEDPSHCPGQRKVLDFFLWYSRTLDTLHAMAERGVFFSVGVEILSSTHIQAIARAVPRAQLPSEMDNPDGLQWLTGVLERAVRTREVVHKLAELRNASREDIIRTVQENLARLMRDDPWLSDAYARFFS